MEPFIPTPLPITIEYNPDLLALMGEANRELIRYDTLLEQSPNSRLLFGPLTRREALLSSRIEGSQSTLSEVFQFEEREEAPDGEKRDDLNEIWNYIKALNVGASKLKRSRFSLDLLKELHAILLGTGSVRGKDKGPGEFREIQNWIGRPGTPMELATYVPPKPTKVAEYMKDLEQYYLSSQPDALVQAAIFHAQFELVHPFRDGNARMGRLMIPLFLYEKKIIAQPVFYLSAYLEENREAYMAALQELSTETRDWHGWIAFFLQAVIEQSKESTAKIKQIMLLYDELKPRVIDLARSRFSIPLLDAIFQKPVFTTTSMKQILQDEGVSLSSPALNTLLQRLVDAAVLQIVAKGKGRRPTLYQFTELIQMLEAPR